MSQRIGRAAVVIVDMQTGFCNQWTDHLAERMTSFLEEIEDTGTPVVGTRYINHERTACYQFEGWKECMAGSPETEIQPVLRPYLQRIFDKDRFSCWDSKMKRFLREQDVDKVYFAGVNTGCCVLNSVFDCYNDLMDCAVIADLCGSTSGPREHDAALVVLRSCITKERVLSAQEAAEEIWERGK